MNRLFGRALVALVLTLPACELVSPERKRDFRFEFSEIRMDTKGIIEVRLIYASGEQWDVIYHCGSVFLLEWREDGSWTRGSRGTGGMVKICPAVYSRPFRFGDTIRFFFDLARFEAGAVAYRVVAEGSFPRIVCPVVH